MAWNWQGALSGGLSGLGLGAGVGTAINPGIGTAIGAGTGGLAGLLGGLLSPQPTPEGGFGGSPEKFGQISRFTPEVQQQINNLLSQTLTRLGSNQFDFGPIEEQARKGFKERTIPGLAERFISQFGSTRSSGFGNALGSAASELESNLAAMKQDYGLRQQSQLQSLLGLGQQEPFYQPRQSGMLEQLLLSLLMGGGRAAGNYLGGASGLSALKGLGGGVL